MGRNVYTSYKTPSFSPFFIEKIIKQALEKLGILDKRFFIKIQDDKNTVSREDAVNYAYYLCDLAMRLNNFSFSVQIRLNFDTLFFTEVGGRDIFTVRYDKMKSLDEMTTLLTKILSNRENERCDEMFIRNTIFKYEEDHYRSNTVFYSGDDCRSKPSAIIVKDEK